MIGKTHWWGTFAKFWAQDKATRLHTQGFTLHLNPNLNFLSPNLTFPPLVISFKQVFLEKERQYCSSCFTLDPRMGIVPYVVEEILGFISFSNSIHIGIFEPFMQLSELGAIEPLSFLHFLAEYHIYLFYFHLSILVIKMKSIS